MLVPMLPALVPGPVARLPQGCKRSTGRFLAFA